MAMLPLTLKNTTASIVTITDVSSIIIPASGQDSFNNANMLLDLAKSTVLQNLVTAGTLVVNNGADLSVAAGLQYLAQIQTQAGFSTSSGIIGLYQMQLGGFLDVPTLPLSGCGIELVQNDKTLTIFQARRGTPGTSGTTTIQLELNGVLIGGAILSWTPGDGTFALKAVSIGVAISQGDRLSFALTSSEISGQDVFAEVN